MTAPHSITNSDPGKEAIVPGSANAPWNDSDTLQLITEYPWLGARMMATRLGRSLNAIRARAVKFGLKEPSQAWVKNLGTRFTELDGSPVCFIPLSKGEWAKIDPEDFDLVCRVSWSLVPTGGTTSYAHGYYLREDKFRIYVSLHKFIMNPDSGMEVDHANGDGLDNRRANLRVCTRLENSRNLARRKRCTSIYKGVGWHKASSAWRAYICHDGRQIQLGRFEDEVEAARAYDDAAKELFGEFARLNLQDARPDIAGFINRAAV